jgi:hypothetical protein
MSFVAYIISIPVAVAIGWMVWNYIEGNVKLDSRMKDGDIGLFDSSQYNISEVIRAPAGSIVEDVQTSPIPMTSSPNSLEGVAPGQYIKQQLPDGRIALIPVSSVSHAIKTVSPTSSMQNNLQHQEQKIEPEQ